MLIEWLRRFCALSATLVSPFMLAQADDLEKLIEKNHIVVGINSAAAPFSAFDKAAATASGFEVDLALQVAKILGMKAEFRALTPTDRVAALHDKRVDVLFATLPKLPELEKEVDYSISYFVGAQKTLSKKGQFTELGQLDKSNVCAVKGSYSIHYLQILSAWVSVVQQQDNVEMLSALQSGVCSLAAGNEGILLYALNKMGSPKNAEFEVSSIPLATEIYAVGMRKGQRRLQKKINDALLEVEASGAAEQIYERWFGTSSKAPLIRTFKMRL